MTTRRRTPIISNLTWVEKKRGGSRPGSGRPKAETVVKKVSLLLDLWQHAEKHGGQDLIRQLLEKHREEFNSRPQSE